MGTISARTVLQKVQKILVDGGVRWTEDELLGWLNSAQRQVVLLRPDASSQTKSVQLQSGTKQTIPTTDLRLLDVKRNMGTDNASPGRAIRLTERDILDAQTPDWHSPSRANSVVRNYCLDERDPRTWYCFPPQPDAGRGYVELLVSVPPAPCTIKDVTNEDGTTGTTDSPITLDDIYENPLIDYTLFRAFSKDATYVAGGSAKSDQALSRFYTALGVKTQSDIKASARHNAPPQVNPNVPQNGGFLGG